MTLALTTEQEIINRHALIQNQIALRANGYNTTQLQSEITFYNSRNSAEVSAFKDAKPPIERVVYIPLGREGQSIDPGYLR